MLGDWGDDSAIRVLAALAENLSFSPSTYNVSVRAPSVTPIAGNSASSDRHTLYVVHIRLRR